MATLDDLAHWWGNDLQVTVAGDAARASGPTRSAMRVYRRLLTNPGEYLSHPDYGAGIRAYVGEVLNIKEIVARIRGQMLLEASVAKSPEPSVSLTQIPGGVQVVIAYTALPDQQPVSLQFPLTGTP